MFRRLAVPAALLAFIAAGSAAAPMLPRETETATVRATVEAPFQGGQSGAVRDQVLATD